MKALLERARRGGRVLLTGGTGYLGALAAAGMLHDGWADVVVVPTRQDIAPGTLPPPILRELEALGACPEDHASRVVAYRWAGAEDASVEALRELMARERIDTVVHCAGCLDYFDEAALNQINVAFTQRVAEAAGLADVSLLAFISSAYAAGYSDAVVPEAALAEPRRDPTHYTATKRAAEHAIAAAGVPFLVIRPSIVIGAAEDGRYSGKRYGVYQQWMGIERLLSERHRARLHVVATDQPLNLVHQDTFQSALLAILARVPDGAHVNLVSDNGSSPSMKALWRQFCDVLRPDQVVFHASLDEVDLKALDLRQRNYLSFARTNLEIGAYPWRFEHGWLDCLRADGLRFTQATLDTVQVCQDRFVAASGPLARYHARFGGQLPRVVEYLEGTPDELDHTPWHERA